jgi:hypothetical protein
VSKVRAQKDGRLQMVEATSQPITGLRSIYDADFLRVLHVDDDLCLLEVAKQILTMENNFEIDGATSVDEAFKKWKSKLTMQLFPIMKCL